MDFDALLITDEGSRFFSTAPLGNDIFSLSGIQASLNGQDGVSFMDNQEILYSIPIRRGDDVVGVLAGKRSKENMQQLINNLPPDLKAELELSKKSQKRGFER